MVIMNSDINETDLANLISEVKMLAEAGSLPTEILRYLITEKGIEGKIQLIVIFRKAFNAELKDVSCIGGWWHEGKHELDDEKLNEYLRPIIQIV